MDIGSLKLGSRVVFGSYTCDPNTLRPMPIIWIKASKRCDFITKAVIDFLLFDAVESNSGGNPQFSLSNLHSFLNGKRWDKWWVKTHEYDTPPPKYCSVSPGEYGFLSEFTEFEISNIVESPSLVRIPTIEDLFGGGFEYFKKGGVRAKWSIDVLTLGRKRRDIGIRTGSENAEYWLQDKSEESDRWSKACVVSRRSSVSSRYVHDGAGVRPVCTISKDAEVELCEDGLYRLSGDDGRMTCSEISILW